MAADPSVRRSAVSQKPRKKISRPKNWAKYIVSQIKKSVQERELCL
jgi:hypothetical protein